MPVASAELGERSRGSGAEVVPGCKQATLYRKGYMRLDRLRNTLRNCASNIPRAQSAMSPTLAELLRVWKSMEFEEHSPREIYRLPTSPKFTRPSVGRITRQR